LAGGKKCRQNFGGETSYKLRFRMAEQEVGGNLKWILGKKSVNM
jgi:hypothetical protein